MPWSTEGSATFVAGSKVVTGNNTNWDPAHIQPGDAIQAADGTIEEILTVNSATEMTLARNFRGASQTNGFFQVLPTRHLGVTLREKVQTLINLVQGDIQPTLDGFQVSFDALIQGYNQILAGWDLSPIDAVLNGAAVDICIDASPLPPLAVQKACSWYNEPLNTATRGARREMPSVRVVVAEINKVTIYDGDDASLPMWMVFEPNGHVNAAIEGNVSSVAMKNCVLVIGCNGYDLYVVNFGADSALQYSVQAEISGTYKGNIAQRNDALGHVFGTVPNIAGRVISDVAMTVIDGAPLDPQTGLLVPTIAVGSDSGVSVIRSDGSVVNSTQSYSVAKVTFDDNENLFSALADYSNVRVYRKGTYNVAGFNESKDYLVQSTPPVLATAQNAANRASALAVGPAIGNANGLTLIDENLDDTNNGMAAFITSDYNTGWMVGATKLAALCETDDADLVGGFVSDRSVSGNDLNVTGNITVSPVATGAELVAYSGFSASNYLEQPYNADLDFGAGDFCIMGWTTNGGDGSVLLERVGADQDGLAGAATDVSDRIYLYTAAASLVYVVIGSTVINTSFNLGSGWQHLALVRQGGNVFLYANSKLVAQAVAAESVGDADHVLRIGTGVVYNTAAWSGDLALWRVSAAAPSPDQIQKIYQDEKRMFQPGAKVTLGADAVTALAHDEITEILHVGHAAGRDEFSGLVNIGGSATPVTKAIAAHDGLIIEE